MSDSDVFLLLPAKLTKHGAAPSKLCKLATLLSGFHFFYFFSGAAGPIRLIPIYRMCRRRRTWGLVELRNLACESSVSAPRREAGVSGHNTAAPASHHKHGCERTHSKHQQRECSHQRFSRNKGKKMLKGHPTLASLAKTPLPLAVAAVKHRLSLPEGISSEDKYEIPQLMLV